MKKITVLVLAASLSLATACEDKEEDIVLPKRIETSKGANGQSGGSDHENEPG